MRVATRFGGLTETGPWVSIPLLKAGPEALSGSRELWTSVDIPPKSLTRSQRLRPQTSESPCSVPYGKKAVGLRQEPIVWLVATTATESHLSNDFLADPSQAARVMA